VRATELETGACDELTGLEPRLLQVAAGSLQPLRLQAREQPTACEVDHLAGDGEHAVPVMPLDGATRLLQPGGRPV
jgi:hypothetical protein